MSILNDYDDAPRDRSLATISSWPENSINLRGRWDEPRNPS